MTGQDLNDRSNVRDGADKPFIALADNGDLSASSWTLPVSKGHKYFVYARSVNVSQKVVFSLSQSSSELEQEADDKDDVNSPSVRNAMIAIAVILSVCLVAVVMFFVLRCVCC